MKIPSLFAVTIFLWCIRPLHLHRVHIWEQNKKILWPIKALTFYFLVFWC